MSSKNNSDNDTLHSYRLGEKTTDTPLNRGVDLHALLAWPIANGSSAWRRRRGNPGGGLYALPHNLSGSKKATSHFFAAVRKRASKVASGSPFRMDKSRYEAS